MTMADRQRLGTADFARSEGRQAQNDTKRIDVDSNFR